MLAQAERWAAVMLRQAGVVVQRIEVPDADRRAAGLPGDALTQLALQLSYRRMTGLLPDVYEPVAMRHYRRWRTERVQPRTRESTALIEALARGTAARVDADLLPAAVTAHRKSVRNIKRGRGYARHLDALAEVARETGDHAALETFLDAPLLRAAWREDVSMSSVSVPAPLAECFVFAPVDQGSFGTACLFDPEGIGLVVTSLHGGEVEFAGHLQTAAQDLLQVARRFSGSEAGGSSA